MEDKLSILWQYFKIKHLRRFSDREQLSRWQDKMVCKFLREILPKSPFYHDRFQGLDIRDWQTLPPIDKSMMMANFDRLNTAGISKDEAFELAIEAERTRDFKPTIGEYTIGLSSGTSGNRGLFIVSQAERNLWAGSILAKALPRSIFTSERIAFFLRANSNLYETVQKQRIRFEYFDLLEPLTSHLDRLTKFQPTILVAPPSMLRLLATAKIQDSLDLQPLKIISVAEVLDPIDTEYLSECFGQSIHQLYQCTEGFLASTCAYGTLHLNEDMLVIEKEYLDREIGKFMPIITDFNRKTQPIIRYRLDDILTERQVPCPCGSVLTALESIEGRCDDLFWLPDLASEKLVPIFPDFIRRAIITASPDIQEYRAVQIDARAIEIFLKTSPQLQPDIEQQVTQTIGSLCDRYRCQMPRLDFHPYPERIERTQKMRRVRRTFAPDCRSSGQHSLVDRQSDRV